MKKKEYNNLKTPRGFFIKRLKPPNKTKIDLERFKEYFEGFKVLETPSENIEENESKKIISLEQLLGEKESSNLITRISSVEDIEGTNMIFAKGSIEYYSNFFFREIEYFYPETKQFQTIFIPEANSNTFYMLVFIRKSDDKLVDDFGNYFLKEQIYLDSVCFEEEDIENIRTVLNGEIIEAFLTNYNSPYVTKKRFYGRQIEKDNGYKKDCTESNVSSNLLRILNPALDNPLESSEKITVSISKDGFIRSYHSISYETAVEIFKCIKKFSKIKKEREVGTFYMNSNILEKMEST